MQRTNSPGCAGAGCPFSRQYAAIFFGMSPEWAEGKTRAEIDAWAEANVEWVKQRFGEERLALAVEIASIPEFIRGFGHVKARHLADAKAREGALLERWRNPDQAPRPNIPIRVAA